MNFSPLYELISSPAGTHTERVNAPGRGIAGKVVFRVTERRMTGEATVERAVDHLLRVFDAHPDRKWFRFDPEAVGEQPKKKIRRAVPDRQHQCAAGDLPAVGRDRNGGTADGLHALNFGMIVELGPEIFQIRDHTRHDLAQTVGADVRPRLLQDLLRRAERNETTKNERNRRIVDPRDQFPVRKRPGAARPELDVGRGVKDAGRTECVDGRNALGKRAAAFQNDGTVPVFGK